LFYQLASHLEPMAMPCQSHSDYYFCNCRWQSDPAAKLRTTGYLLGGECSELFEQYDDQPALELLEKIETESC